MYITMTVLSGNLIGSTTGMDEMASARRYRDLLGEALLERWPQAAVEITVEHAEGVGSPIRVFVGDAEAPDLEDEAETIASRVWLKGDWVIEEGEGR